jgi:hypothetical protein
MQQFDLFDKHRVNRATLGAKSPDEYHDVLNVSFRVCTTSPRLFSVVPQHF